MHGPYNVKKKITSEILKNINNVIYSFQAN